MWCSKCGVDKELSEFEPYKRLRFGVTHRCRQCATAYKLEWSRANRERSKASKRAWKKRNPEKNAAINKAWWARNSDKGVPYQRTYYKRFPGKAHALTGKRRAAEMQACPKWADLVKIRAFYDEAARLTKETDIRHQVDHIIPLRGKLVCGLHVHNNMQILTINENAQKSNLFSAEEA